ncbi:acetyl-CoA C-acetyltransferase [Rhizobiales bacterium GAS188]|nr:acetyl-CoA C-acetyltransferase [Rhizobiales bacterium GAS188]
MSSPTRSLEPRVADRAPVIVGVGEIVDRPRTLSAALEPAALIAEALRRADADGGGGWLTQLAGLEIINSVSWPYADLPGRVADLIGKRPPRLVHGPVGGETPVRCLHEAALRIRRGESEVEAVAGGEAEHSVQQARKAGFALPWTEPDPSWVSPRVRDYLHKLALRHGLSQPVFVYPLYEVATQADWGQIPAQGQAASAALWSRFSQVAAANPYAWIDRPREPEEIATVGGANRLIAWPYPKLMVANPNVNQGAAILVTSFARACGAGVDPARLTFIGAGAGANEPRDWVSRDGYSRSHAQDAVLKATLRRAQSSVDDLAAIELYSCFPCVPKMAARTLKLSPEATPTVAGGLTFFGAPLNNYMTHAAAAMTRLLRATPGRAGLLYGQGEFVTKHYALMLASRPIDMQESLDPSVQGEADRRRGPIPVIAETADGAAAIETHTVMFDHAGEPTKGVVVLRQPDGARTLARVPGDDHASLAILMDANRSAVGRGGILSRAADSLLEWRAA